MSSLLRRNGEMTTIHQGPGMGRYRSETTVREATMSCRHCRTVVVINPLRTRERSFCRRCNAYLCDRCKAVSLAPNYIHRTAIDLADLISSGNWQLIGSPSSPILIPT